MAEIETILAQQGKQLRVGDRLNLDKKGQRAVAGELSDLQEGWTAVAVCIAQFRAYGIPGALIEPILRHSSGEEILGGGRRLIGNADDYFQPPTE